METHFLPFLYCTTPIKNPKVTSFKSISRLGDWKVVAVRLELDDSFVKIGFRGLVRTISSELM
jgi:hypothetical protein